MRPLLPLVLLSLLALPFVAPSASAAHIGPCWHEYAEAVLFIPFDARQNGWGYALGNAGQRIGGCIDGLFWWVGEVCHDADVCTIIACAEPCFLA